MYIVHSDAPLLACQALVGLVLSCIAIIFKRYCRKFKFPLPPGPPLEFLLGHYRIVPEDAAFKTYADWAKQYRMYDWLLHIMLCSLSH